MPKEPETTIKMPECISLNTSYSEVDEFLKKVELEDPESRKYYLKIGETPTQDLSGALLVRLINPDDPNEYQYESYLYDEQEEEMILIFYTQPGDINNIKDLYDQLLLHYDNPALMQPTLKTINENYTIQ